MAANEGSESGLREQAGGREEEVGVEAEELAEGGIALLQDSGERKATRV